MILILIIGVIFGYTFRTLLLLKKTLALEKNTQPYAQKPDNFKKTILFIGDSTAVGTGSAYSYETIAGRFGKNFPEAYIINEGINGQKIKELAENLDPSKYQYVNLLVIQIGANDIVQFTPYKKVEENLKMLLGKATKISPKVLIIHGGNVGNAPIFPKLLSFIWSDRTRYFREIYTKETLSYNVIYVDLYQDRKNDIFLSNPKLYYANDLFHPTGDGYRIWFEKIIKSL